MDDNDVSGRVERFVVRRVFLPERATESFTVIGPDLRPVELVDKYLAWLTDCERSPNTVEGYAHDLRAFWTFLTERGLGWDQVGVDGARRVRRVGAAAGAERGGFGGGVGAFICADGQPDAERRGRLLRVPGQAWVDARAGSGRQDTLGPGWL
ncbi:MAG: site-specific integrase [Solirubrobacteraceae bacterium]